MNKGDEFGSMKKSELKLEGKDLETIPSKVCRILRDAILKGDFKPGQRLVQDELASLIGVSRMPVREAIKRLEAEGLVTIEPHRGAIVKSFDLQEIEEIYHLRCLLEKEAVKDSVQHITPAILDQLEKIVLQMEETEDIETFVKLNIRFHHALISCCPWKRLTEMIESLWNGFPQQTPHILPEQMEHSKEEHKAILQAVVDQDAIKAAELIKNHIQRTGKEIIKNMKNEI